MSARWQEHLARIRYLPETADLAKHGREDQLGSLDRIGRGLKEIWLNRSLNKPIESVDGGKQPGVSFDHHQQEATTPGHHAQARGHVPIPNTSVLRGRGNVELHAGDPFDRGLAAAVDRHDQGVEARTWLGSPDIGAGIGERSRFRIGALGEKADG